MTTEDDFTPSDLPKRAASTADADPRRYFTNADGTTRDRVLDRPVVARTSTVTNADELQAEARFLGRLTHAGLPCVLDFVRSDEGATLVTQPIIGRSLAAAIAARASGNDVSQLADTTTCTLFFIQICDALTAAHLRGVVHGALAPDVIILGDDGQIVIDGWSQAMKAMQRPLTMRVSAHAPVPAALSADGLHDDIRALGTCFYTALAGEAPSRTADGHLSEVSITAQRHIPSALEAVIRKAMTSTAGQGYHSVAEVRADLTRFLTGQIPLAVGPSGLAIVLHALSTHARGLAVAALSIAVLIGALIAYNWREVKTFATWGAPLIDEHFDSDSWKNQWKSMGTWERQDGRIVSKSEYECALIYHERLNPPVAIEYNGTFSSAVRAGDLSVWWCEGDAFTMPAGSNVDDLNSWWIQAGAISNSWCTIWQTPSRVRSQVNNLVLAPDVDHHFRVEIETDSLKMWIDGKLALEHHELFPIGSGTVALYTWDPGKSFDNVRIWQKDVPELISPLAIGDEAYRAGKYNEAAIAYGRVAVSHRGKPLGDQAVYFQGLAQHKQGNPAMARKTWQDLPDGILHHRADCLSIDEYIDQLDLPAAADRFSSLWREHPEIHDVLIQRWQVCGQRLRKKRPILSAEMDKWMAVREATFPEDSTSRWLVAEMLNLQQRWEEVIQRFPDEHRAVVPAMLALGRNKEVLDASWSTSYERISAMSGMGDLEGALRSPDLHKSVRAEILCKMGKFDESSQIAPFPSLFYKENIDDELQRGVFGASANMALIAAGRLEEAAGAGVAGSPESGKDGTALILLGRLDDAEKEKVDTRLYRVLDLLKNDRIDEARALRPALVGKRNTNSCWFDFDAGLSLIDVALGNTNALRKSMEHGATVTGAWGGKMALVCQAALDPTKDAAVSAMPYRTEAAAWLCVAQALRGELTNDHHAAATAWKAFKALPMRQRLVDGHNVCVELETIAAWRIAALSKLALGGGPE